MATGIEIEMVLDDLIKSINEGIETKTGVAKFLKITSYAFDKKAKEEGYVWNKAEKKYVKIDEEIEDNLNSNFDGIINFENDFVLGVKNDINVNTNSSFETENKIKNEISSNINTEIKNDIDSNIKTEINSSTEIKTERNIEMEKEIEIKNGSNFNMKEMLPKTSKPKFKPVTVHLREDINDAIDKFVEGEGKGAKQELINKMLEMILKENNLL